MRYLKLTNANDPDIDSLELNDFNGYLCTQFQTIGISRSIEYLTIKNRNIPVSNTQSFKKYSLTIELLFPYSQYEAKHSNLLAFLDRNKKDGLRLYYKPYEGEEMRYCLCSIESSAKTEKRQPVLLTLSQNSMWYGVLQDAETVSVEQSGNMFAFFEDSEVPPENEGNRKYYAAGFKEDPYISNYYSLPFYNNASRSVDITNPSYNEVPLTVKIYGGVNPVVSLFEKGGTEPIKILQIYQDVRNGYHLEINANILESGVWLVNDLTGEKKDASPLVDYNNGSPYWYIGHGDYTVSVRDNDDNDITVKVSWRGEYSA